MRGKSILGANKREIEGKINPVGCPMGFDKYEHFAALSDSRDS